jgi:hypothetical protein
MHLKNSWADGFTRAAVNAVGPDDMGNGMGHEYIGRQAIKPPAISLLRFSRVFRSYHSERSEESSLAIRPRSFTSFRMTKIPFFNNLLNSSLFSGWQNKKFCNSLLIPHYVLDDKKF